MDPIPIAVTPQLIVPPNDRFLARAAFQPVSLHSRKVNPHCVFVTP